MLSRVAGCNKEIERLKVEEGPDWDWENELILI